MNAAIETKLDALLAGVGKLLEAQQEPPAKVKPLGLMTIRDVSVMYRISHQTVKGDVLAGGRLKVTARKPRRGKVSWLICPKSAALLYGPR